ncbi:major histocompatibility complex class I UXA2 precursor [Silurus meridionalis]|nr:major histocompatibility complex class I UXA2 precursor [Silurus meridionalis]
MIPKTQWIQNISADYWDRETQKQYANQEIFIFYLDVIKQEFNQTEGIHTLQRMYGCEIDVNGTTRGYDQYGYDGEDFFSLDLNTGSWTAVNDEVEIFINRWDSRRSEAEYWRNFLETECIDWIKKFVSYSRETLEGKIPPAASVFQKNSSSPEVVCHATGFFPKALIIKWQKDGEDVYEDVELRETLPNEDGSFQKRSILKVSAEELQKHTYTCVIEHSSLEKEMVLKVLKDSGSDGGLIGIIVGVVMALVVLVIGIVFWKNKNFGKKEKKTGFKRVSSRSHPHSLQYLHTGLPPGTHFPEFTAVGLFDGEQFVYYDSNISRMIPKTEWIQNISADYWDRETQKQYANQEIFKIYLDYGYDGEDFFSLDLNTGSWTAVDDEVEIFINRWDPRRSEAKYWKNFMETECIDWIKKFVSMERKVPPAASVFQKHSSSPEVVCHATGFFPKALNICWQKDGVDVYKGVDLRKTLPNQDGSFQKRSILKVSAEELQKHTVLKVPKGPDPLHIYRVNTDLLMQQIIKTLF